MKVVRLKVELAVTVTLNSIFKRFARPFTFRRLTVFIEFHMIELDVRLSYFFVA